MRRRHENSSYIAKCYKWVNWFGMAETGVDWSAGLKWHRAELIGIAQSGVDWSAGFDWHRAKLTGALDWNGTERR